METRQVKLGVIGLGGRGIFHAAQDSEMSNVKIVAVCDLYEDRVATAQRKIQERANYTPLGYTDYHELLKNPEIEAVMITTSWTTHIKIACDALRAGKHAAVEVCGANSIGEIWEIVHLVEQTGLKCMFLENCNYDRLEMMTLNMVKKGLFGEVLHCRGAYSHDLRGEITHGLDNIHYRYNNYRHRNGELYPTHALGPIAKILKINRGNRFLTISSTATKSVGLALYAEASFAPDHPARANKEWTEGDVVTSVIKCAHGETIILNHDTTLPHPYSRNFYVQGTKGVVSEDKHGLFLEGISPAETWENVDPYYEKYEHPLWKYFEQSGIKAQGHGGMDWMVDSAYFDCILNDTPSPIDVYDLAAWMAITVLSEESIAMGGAPVAFPDFTSGRWVDGTMPMAKGMYALDTVDEEAFKEILG